MVVATGGGWMRFKWASHFLSTEHAVWFRKESFYTLASFTLSFNPFNSTWDPSKNGKREWGAKGYRAGLCLHIFPQGTPPAEPGLLAFSSGCRDPKQLSYGNG